MTVDPVTDTAGQLVPSAWETLTESWLIVAGPSCRVTVTGNEKSPPPGAMSRRSTAGANCTPSSGITGLPVGRNVHHRERDVECASTHLGHAIAQGEHVADFLARVVEMQGAPTETADLAVVAPGREQVVDAPKPGEDRVEARR